MKAFALSIGVLALLAAAAFLGGCKPQAGNPQPEKLPPLLEQGRSILANPATEPADAPRGLTYVELTLAEIEAPAGAISGDPKIWSYLGEAGPKPLGEADLAANGIRIGITNGAKWEELASALEKATGRPVTRQLIRAEMAKPIPVVIRPGQPQRTVFLTYRDGTSNGTDYQAGDYIMALSFIAPAGQTDRSMLTAAPQIRSARRKPVIEQSGGRYMLTERPEVQTIYPLAFQMQIPAGAVLVIGPSPQAASQSSLGGAFFITQREGVSYERLFLISAKLVVR